MALKAEFLRHFFVMRQRKLIIVTNPLSFLDKRAPLVCYDFYQDVGGRGGGGGVRGRGGVLFQGCLIYGTHCLRIKCKHNEIIAR